MDRIQSLLKRLGRSLPSQPGDEGSVRPPDEATFALTAQLGVAYGEAIMGLEDNQRDIEALRGKGSDVMDALAKAAISPSAVCGFCQGVLQTVAVEPLKATGTSTPATLVARALQLLLPWWSSWMAECDDAATRTSLIRTYAKLSYRLVVGMISFRDHTDTCTTSRSSTGNHDSSSSSPSSMAVGGSFLSEAYSNLSHNRDRHTLIRESVSVAFSNICGSREYDGVQAGRICIGYLSEITASSIILAPSTSDQARLLLWTTMLRECHLSASTLSMVAMSLLIPWLTKCLYLTIVRNCCADAETKDDIYSMFEQLCDLISRVERIIQDEALSSAIDLALGSILPFFPVSRYNLSISISQLCNALCATETKAPRTISEATLFQLCLLVLNTADETGIALQLKSLHKLVKGCHLEQRNLLLVDSLRAVAFISSTNWTDARFAGQLRELASELQRNIENGHSLENLSAPPEHVMSLYRKGRKGPDAVRRSQEDGLLQSILMSSKKAPPIEQTCAVIISYSLACRNDNDFALLSTVIEKRPYLGIRAIPLVTASIQSSVAVGDGEGVIAALRFLCSTAAIDATCAQRVWELVSNFTEANSPISLRTSCLRLYVLLCKSNRKLYPRICEKIGYYVTSLDASSRISAFSTLCDLAKEDLIRDVTEIIGWLQNGLLDEECVVVYYVIMTLHHLLEEGELDFDVVIKVISKKIPINDVSTILSLPCVVIESLATLFGDGANNVDDDSDEGESDDDCDDDENVLSYQAKSAIGKLFDLANLFGTSTTDEDSRRILQCIYKSLARYDANCLGIDSDLVRFAAERPSDESKEAIERYALAQKIILDGMLHATNDTLSKEPSLQELAAKIINIEEDALGPSLFKKAISSSSSKSQRRQNRLQKVSKAVLAVLPAPSLIESHYEDNQCTATAIAAMLCIDNATESAPSTKDLVERLFEIANDIKNDISDDLCKTMSISSWLVALQSIWSSISADNADFNIDLVNEVKDELLDCGTSPDQHDISLMALSAFVFVLPDRYEGIDMTQIVVETHSLVLDAHKSQRFADQNIAATSIGFVGSKYAKSMALDRVEELLSLLLYGERSFHVLFSLGFICQTLSSSLDTLPAADLAKKSATKLIGRICGAILSELHVCMVERVPSMLNIIGCLQSDSASLDLSKCMQEAEETQFNFSGNESTRAKGVFIALSVALPSLRHLNALYLQMTTAMLSKLPFGYGKGFALATMYHHALSLSKIASEEMESLYSQCLDVMTSASNENSSDDALFAAIAFHRMMPSDESRDAQILSLIDEAIGGNKSMLALCSYLGSLPFFSGSFDPHLYLNSEKTSIEDIVEMLTSAAMDSGVSRRFSDMATILLGVLCRMKFSGREGERQIFAGGSDVSISKNYAAWPRAQDSTLLSKILNLIEKHLGGGKGNNSSIQQVAPLISCISTIPLPGVFSSLAKKAVNDISEGKGEIKVAFIELMVAQIKSERHSGPHRADFINLSTYIARLTPNEFWSLFASSCEGAAQFMSATSSFLVRWPSGIIEEILNNLWGICSHEISSRNSSSCATSLLQSLSEALKQSNNNVRDQIGKRGKSSTAMLSPAVLSSTRRMLPTIVFPSLVAVANVPTTDLWKAFLSCIEHIPSSLLDECGLLSIRNDNDFETNVAQIRCIAYLSKSCGGEFFGKNTVRELSKGQSWIQRQKISQSTSNQLKALRLAIFQLAANFPVSAPADHYKGLILNSFEAMLVNGLDSMSLEQLAVQCTYWIDSQALSASKKKLCNHVGSLSLSHLLTQGDATLWLSASLESSRLSDMINLFLRDIPVTLLLICDSLHISSLVCNRCLRIISAIESNRSSSNFSLEYELFETSLTTLKEIATCCCEFETNGVQYVKIFGSEMVEKYSRFT